MLASRAHLAKQAAAMLVRQPACLMHHGGDWGNWGNTNVAVVFSGCGWWDGTDIHEAAYTMYHLSRNGARFQIFAPNQQQMHVMDHMKMQPSSSDNRNMMIESARFSHGQGMMQMNDLSKLDVSSFDAVIFPGGHGVVKNLILLCLWLSLSSMAPLLACRVLPNLEVTMGYERDESSRWGRWPNTTMVQAVKSMGARHNTREPYEAYVDEKNKVISTPTFMWETDFHYHYIFDGIGNMVKHVMRMTAK
ncbi:ES1 protein, mitochondrial-like [Sinocyclocheilus rhinocerous]|uniref:ES1 protein, mitochondrial-like n=1 Tax=Sinocyclocheilus rhinocerous TaxID=307959 RepID=UPI0007B7B77B|nr:PREDICTED: ES1 protein, mitochondrial-like [Sinocyclocheilus rhinocerous]